jgi:hypothetical protein
MGPVLQIAYLLRDAAVGSEALLELQFEEPAPGRPSVDVVSEPGELPVVFRVQARFANSTTMLHQTLRRTKQALELTTARLEAAGRLGELDGCMAVVEQVLGLVAEADLQPA